MDNNYNPTDAAEQFLLGLDYYKQGNAEQAIYWYTIAAEQGYMHAQNNLGIMCKEQGDLQNALYWFVKAAEQGNAGAQFNAGMEYSDAGNIEHAIYWYQRAAEQGSADAMNNLGFIYNRKGDSQQTLNWYTKAAELGSMDAQNNLGVQYEKRGDFERSAYWSAKAAEQGDTRSAERLHRVNEKLDVLRAAGQGDMAAQQRAGMIFHEQENYQLALYWFNQAAQQGHVIAQESMGTYYINGDGVEKNIESAIYWYEQAAQQGHAVSQNYLGNIYHEQKSYQKALYWYSKAAEQDNADAQYQMGQYYENGYGVNINKDVAQDWYYKASKNGHAWAGKAATSIISASETKAALTILLVILLPVLPFILHAASYLFGGYIPGDANPHDIFYLRVESQGEPVRGSVKSDSGTVYSLRDGGTMACMRIVYYDNDYGTEDSRIVEEFSIVDENRETLFTIPKSAVNPRDMLTLDLDTGRITKGISFPKYFFGMLSSAGIGGSIRWLVILLVLALGVVLVIMTPFAFAAMVYSIVREKAAGVKRRFVGVYARAIYGILLAGVFFVLIFFDREGFAEMMNGRTLDEYIVIILYAIGGALYPFACRMYDADEILENMRRKAEQEYARVNTFTYTVTRWKAEGYYSNSYYRTSNYLEKKVGRSIGYLIMQLIRIFFSPFMSYIYMIKYYLFKMGAWKIDYILTDEDMERLRREEQDLAKNAGTPQQ